MQPLTMFVSPLSFESLCVYSLKRFSSSIPYAFTIGNFDGLHKGHQQVIHILKEKSALLPQGETLLFTFINHLKQTQESTGLIYSLSTKKKVLASLGIHNVVFLEFERLRQLDYTTFLDLLLSRFNVKSFVASRKLKMGVHRKGSATAIRNHLAFRKPELETFYFTSLAMDLDTGKIASPYCGSPSIENLSSTKIRKNLEQGKIKEANQVLPVPFHVDGKVLHGKKLARKLGFPTANFSYPENQVRLPSGSYITLAEIKLKGIEKQFFPAVTFVKATGEKEIVESHLFNFEHTVYNKIMRVFFIVFIRKYFPFTDLKQARYYIARDATEASSFFQKNSLITLQNTIKNLNL